MAPHEAIVRKVKAQNGHGEEDITQDSVYLQESLGTLYRRQLK